MLKLSTWPVAVLTAALLAAPLAHATIHKFDMGPEGSPVWEGFAQITPKSVYSKEAGHGWRKPAGRGITHRLRGVPDALACDLVGATDSPHGYYSGEMEFMLDLPDGDYSVHLLTADFFGKRDEAYRSHRPTISAEGEIKARRAWTRDQWLQNYALRGMNDDYRKGDDLYDKYVAPLTVPTIFDVTVSDGQLNLAFSTETVSALIVYPTHDAAQAKEFLAELDRRRRAEFDYKDETPKPDGSFQGATAEDKKRGYALFFPRLEQKVYPFDHPQPEQRDRELKAFATLGEFEPVTFAVHPLKDLGTCRITISDLKRMGRGVMSASAWEVRVVRYLELPEKRGRRTYRIEPLLLEKRDHADIEQGVNKQFWLTVKVPEDARPGRYKGKVTFKPENGRASEVPLMLLVLPFKLKPLEENNRYQGVWHTYPKYTITREHIAADLRDHGINVIHTPPRPTAKLVDGKIVFPDLTDVERFLETFRSAGFPMKLIVWQGALRQAYALANEPTHDAAWLKAHGGRSDHQVKKSFSKEFDDVYRKLARAIDDLFKEKGWPEIYFYDAGEGGTEGYWGIWTETHLLKLQKEAGVKGSTSVVGLDALEAELPYLYAAQISSRNASPEVRARIRKAGSRLWLYGFGGSRFQRGLLFWKTGAEGCAIEGYAHVYGEAYNEFDGAYAYEGEVWPSPDGPVPTIHWELLREGIDDCKYLSHLDLLIKQAAESPDKSVRQDAADGQETLDEIMAEINPDIQHYDRHGVPDESVMAVSRWKATRHIKRLEKAMKKK